MFLHSPNLFFTGTYIFAAYTPALNRNANIFFWKFQVKRVMS